MIKKKRIPHLDKNKKQRIGQNDNDGEIDEETFGTASSNSNVVYVNGFNRPLTFT